MSIQGDLLVVIATVCWDSYAVLSLPLLRTHPPLVVAAFTMLFGGLAAAPFALRGFVSAEWGELGLAGRRRPSSRKADLRFDRVDRAADL